MARNKHELDDNEKKQKKSLTKILGVLGRSGPLSVAQIEKDPILSGRYVYPLLKDLCPVNDIVLVKRLFSWNDLVACPEKTEKKLKEQIKKLLPGKPTVTVNSGSIESGNGKQQGQLRIIQKMNWIKFQIKYALVKERKIEKPVFHDDSFKVTRFNGARERSIDSAFSLYRKSGKLYVYSTEYSNRHYKTHLNKTIDKNKIEQIERMVIKKLVKYMNGGVEVPQTIHNIISNHLEITKSKNIGKQNFLKTFGYKAASQIEAISKHVSLGNDNKFEESDRDRILRLLIQDMVINEIHKPRYWLYSINIRGLMKYCVTESQNMINKIIKNLSSDPKYEYYHYNQRFRSEDGHYYLQALFESFRDVKFNREDDRGEVIREEIMAREQFLTMIKREEYAEEENENVNLEKSKVSLKVDDLDFPFLLYHDQFMKAKILPENFVAIELKQIAKRLRGLNEEVPLSELTYQVTNQYYKDFEFFMNDKTILGMKSRIDEIKTDDANLYKMVMNYQITVLSYIKSVEERKTDETNGRLSILNMALEKEPKSNVSMIARITTTGIELINQSNI